MKSFSDPAAVLVRLKRLRNRAGRGLFGDRTGLALFLGTLCFVTLFWQNGLVINDNATLVAGLWALSEGHFWIEPATGDYLISPGTNVRDGYVYGRNYGQIAFALPAYWALQALDAIADLRVGLVAVWHLLALAFAVQLGHVLDRFRGVALAGGAFVLVSFFANVAVATQFSSVSLSLLALQTTAAVAAAFVAVFLYRTVALRRNRRLGLLTGAAATVAMPIGFWATVPKRHAFSALVCVGVLYAFARSRKNSGPVVPGFGRVPVYRAGAYALVGLFTWIHAGEGLFLFLALVLVDVPTAPSNDARTLSFVGLVFAVSLLPTLGTNALVSGDPFRPPRTMRGGGLTGTIQQGGTSGGGTGLLHEIGWFLSTTGGLVWDGVVSFTQFQDVYRTFVRSSVEGIDQQARFLGVNLAMLEAAPLLGALGVLLLTVIPSRARRVYRQVTPTDILAVSIVVAFALLYISRLPLNTMFTVRYLLPLYPLGAYLVFSAAPVRHLVEGHLTTALWSYATGVFIGGQLLFAFLVLNQYAIGEAARVQALLGVVLGIVLAIVCALSALDERFEAPAVLVFGLAAAAGTVLLLVSGLYYFSYAGEYILPVVGEISEILERAV